MGAPMRTLSITLAIFACILYTTNSQRFNNPWYPARDDFYDDDVEDTPFNPPSRPTRHQPNPSSRQRDGIQFPSSLPQQGGRPESPVNLGSRPLNQNRPFQQQQQGNFQQGNFPQQSGWPQQGSGNVQQRPQVGGNQNQNQRPRPAAGPGCSCSSTEEYNPVCGSDNTTYSNPGRITCANNCGNPITLLYHGVCRVSSGPRG